MKYVHRILFVIQAFVGIGAIAGGLGAIMNPVSPMGVSVDLLKHSPFHSYLIPGILLFAVIGIGSLGSAIAIPFKLKYQGYISSVSSWALVIWIVIQCIMLHVIAALHVIFFIIGAVEAVLSAAILFEQRLFPANIILDIIKEKNEEAKPL